MRAIDGMHQLVNALSGWTVVALVVLALLSVYVFYRVFESDFKQID